MHDTYNLLLLFAHGWSDPNNYLCYVIVITGQKVVGKCDDTNLYGEVTIWHLWTKKKTKKNSSELKDKING